MNLHPVIVRLAIGFGLLCWPSIPALAHSGLHHQIREVTEALAREPNRVDLHLTRAHLHRLHHDWDSAAADIAGAASLGADPADVGRARAVLLLDRGFPSLALASLPSGASRPDDQRLRAAALRALGLARSSTQALELVLAAQRKPNPDWILELCNTLPRLPEAGPRARQRTLESALARSGPVPALVAAASEGKGDRP